MVIVARGNPEAEYDGDDEDSIRTLENSDAIPPK